MIVEKTITVITKVCQKYAARELPGSSRKRQRRRRTDGQEKFSSYLRLK